MPYRSVEDRRANSREHYLKNRDHYRIYRCNWAKRKANRKLEELAGRPRPAACEICGGSGGGRSKDHGTVWDHDHVTGKFRGWICSPCNSILGFAKDSSARLRKMADYLDNGGIGPGPSPNEVDKLLEMIEQSSRF